MPGAIRPAKRSVSAGKANWDGKARVSAGQARANRPSPSTSDASDPSSGRATPNRDARISHGIPGDRATLRILRAYRERLARPARRECTRDFDAQAASDTWNQAFVARLHHHTIPRPSSGILRRNRKCGQVDFGESPAFPDFPIKKIRRCALAGSWKLRLFFRRMRPKINKPLRQP